MYMHTKAELAPEEDQGVLFALTKAPQYSNLDYQEAYTDKLDQAFGSFPETDLRFIVNGRFGPNQGIAGVILKPWGERSRSAQQLKPLMQQKAAAVEGMNAFVFSLPPLPGSIGGLPVQMVIYSTGGYKDIYLAMDKIKAAARKSGLFMVTDSDLDFNQPTIQVKVDRSKVNELGLTMQSIGDTLALLVGENYVNRFNLDGRSYKVIPQVPRVDRLTPDTLTQYYVTYAVGAAGAAVQPGVSRDRHPAQFADPVQPAELGDLPGGADAGRDDGPGGRFSRAADQEPAGRLQPRLPVRHAPIRAGRQSADDHLRLRADRDLSRAGGAIREPARSAGDPRQRADVDVRGVDAAVLRPGDDEHLHPGRARHPDRADQQARHPDGRVRQYAAGAREPRPPARDRARRAGAACGRS